MPNRLARGCDAADALLESLDSIAFARWMEGARRSAGANDACLRRVVAERHLHLLDWRIRDAVETIAWYRAPRHLRTAPATLAARQSAARAVLALAVAEHLSQAERDDLYGIFMRGVGLG